MPVLARRGRVGCAGVCDPLAGVRRAGAGEREAGDAQRELAARGEHVARVIDIFDIDDGTEV